MSTVADALNLAVEHHQRGQFSAAEPIYRQILQQQPDHAGTLRMLGLLLSQTGRAPDGIGLLERAVLLSPSLPGVYGHLGFAQLALGRNEEALASFDEALRREPNNADALSHRAAVQQRLGLLEEALANYRRCVELQPDRLAAHANQGVILQELARYAEAQASYERAIELSPANAVLHTNLGCAVQNQGNLAVALECFERALSLDPKYTPALANRGVVQLSLGDFEAGWVGYDYRQGFLDCQQLPQPMWDGSPLAGRTLLILCEQGFGDTLQFIRYMKMIHPDGGQIRVLAQPELISLLEQSGYTGLVARGGPLPSFDLYVPLLSLPRIFGTRLEKVPREVPYLSVDEARMAAWRERLQAYGGLKVGISWQGRKTFRGDLVRSLPLTNFAPLVEVSNVQFFSLQKSPGSDQLAAIKDRWGVVDLSPALETFLDTAAVMKNLDLIVTSDTAVAHLAGALGVPVWVALSRVPDWRWLLERSDNPWYPSMRLFRQTTLGDWPPVFRNIAAELRDLAGGG